MATQDQIFLGNIHVTNAAAQSQLYAGNGAMSATTMRCHEQQYTFRYQHRGSDNSPSSRTGCAVMKAGSTDHFAFSAQFRRGRVKIRGDIVLFSYSTFLLFLYRYHNAFGDVDDGLRNRKFRIHLDHGHVLLLGSLNV